MHGMLFQMWVDEQSVLGRKLIERADRMTLGTFFHALRDILQLPPDGNQAMVDLRNRATHRASITRPPVDVTVEESTEMIDVATAAVMAANPFDC